MWFGLVWLWFVEPEGSRLISSCLPLLVVCCVTVCRVNVFVSLCFCLYTFSIVRLSVYGRGSTRARATAEIGDGASREGVLSASCVRVCVVLLLLAQLPAGPGRVPGRHRRPFRAWAPANVERGAQGVSPDKREVLHRHANRRASHAGCSSPTHSTQEDTVHNATSKH